LITVHNLQRIFETENEIIHEQVNGLTQADSLLQPQPGGNCLNWVLGHLLTNQVEIIQALGGMPPFNPAQVARYDRNSEPIHGEEEGVLPLNTLVSMHDQTHETINQLLDSTKEEDFEKETQSSERKTTLGWRVFFLHFHYTYHLGQLEYLRQLAGKLDKII
jgi:uncharacterized damage-inducible protein DinB